MRVWVLCAEAAALEASGAAVVDVRPQGVQNSTDLEPELLRREPGGPTAETRASTVAQGRPSVATGLGLSEKDLARLRERAPSGHAALHVGRHQDREVLAQDKLLLRDVLREEHRSSFAYRASYVVSKMHEWCWLFGILTAISCAVVFVVNSPGKAEQQEDCEQNWVLDAATQLKIAPRTAVADKRRGSKDKAAMDLPRGSKIGGERGLLSEAETAKLLAIDTAQEEQDAAAEALGDPEPGSRVQDDWKVHLALFWRDLKRDQKLQLALVYISFLVFRFVIFSMAASSVLLGADYPRTQELTPTSDEYLELAVEHGSILYWGLLCGQLKQLIVFAVTPILFAVAATHWIFGFFFPIVCAEEMHYVRTRRNIHKSAEVCVRVRTQVLMFVITLFFLTVPCLELIEYMLLTKWNSLQIVRYVCLLLTYALSLRWVFTALAFQIWAFFVLLPLMLYEVASHCMALCRPTDEADPQQKPWSLSQAMCSRRVRQGWDDRRVAVYDLTWFFYTHL